MTRAIILAGGLGTRLYKYTNGVYPKILLSLGNDTMFDRIINFWFKTQEVDELFLVFSEQDHINIVTRYVAEFFPQYQSKIKICKYSKTDGTFNTLYYVFNMHPQLLNDNLLISWSDIVPLDKLNVDTTKDPLIKIFTDPTNIHRFEFKDNLILHSPQMNGNIVGIYQIANIPLWVWWNYYTAQKITNKELDVVIFFGNAMYYFENPEDWKNSPKVLKGENIDVFDIGDVQKYEAYLKTVDTKQRWFNDIKFDQGVVTKSANSEYGQKVINDEIGFYKHIKDTDAENVFPEIFSLENKIVMRDLTVDGYKTVFEAINCLASPTKILHAYNDAIHKLHYAEKTSLVNFNNDIYKEYIQVPIERYAKIEYFLPNCTAVNDNPVPLFYDIINRLLAYLKARTYTFGMIHGDTNSTNTMYNYNGDGSIKFIDPRGKFGDSKIYGDVAYDNAKFLYGLTGYDNFNLDKEFKFEIIKESIHFDIKGIEKLDEYCDNDHLKILVGLIWLKLPFYIRNNPNKIIASYFNGIYLLNKYLPK